MLNIRVLIKSFHITRTFYILSFLFLFLLKCGGPNEYKSLIFFVTCMYAGYLIPKGWKVMPLFRNIHHNPKYFSNPEVFDPSRFEVIIKKLHAKLEL